MRGEIATGGADDPAVGTMARSITQYLLTWFKAPDGDPAGCEYDNNLVGSEAARRPAMCTLGAVG